jgi:L,D-transpeptidase ErfK/SrfK
MLLVAALPAASPSLCPFLIGREWTYRVQPHDTVAAIAQRYGLEPRFVRRQNGLKTKSQLAPGQTLVFNTHHLAPDPRGSVLVVNIPDHRLYRYAKGKLAASYPVGLGESFDETDEQEPKKWQTPVGAYRIEEKRAHPVWNIPPSIQAELKKKGKPVKEQVLPGKDNPLGDYYIGLSAWGYGIHGTIAPWSVGRYSTHGCMRLRNTAIKDVFEHVKVGDRVRILYEPVKVSRLDGHLWVEVAGDPYERYPSLIAIAQTRLKALGWLSMAKPEALRLAATRFRGAAVRVDGAIVPPSRAVPLARPSATGSLTPPATR